MAMFDCKECGQRVSDKAASCPSCGAPIAARPAGRARMTAFAVIAAAAAALLATLYWFNGPPDRLAEVRGVLDRGAAPSPVVPGVLHPAALVARTDTGSRGVYETTAEQLYKEYSANPVAAQGRIDGRHVRITGRVAAIDEDALGHPQVRLATGTEDSLDLLLRDDQKSVVAELAKGDTVDIQCDKIQRDPARPAAASPEGSGCGLALVDERAAEAYLAVFMSPEKGRSPVYIVGPMSKDVCQGQSDRISDELAGNLKHDQVVSKNCAATAHDSIPLEGCRLSSSMSSLPDLPQAHLWKYDCVAPAAAAAVHATQASAPAHKSLVRVAQTNIPAVADEDADIVASLPTFASPVATPATLNTQVQVLAPAASPLVAAGGAEPVSDANTVGAAAAVGATAAVVGATAASGAAMPAVAKSPGLPSDLAGVNEADSNAAQHIASYCDTATASAANQPTVAAGCRREEIAAWTRLVKQNEFPTMDDVTRQKCSQPPFPDSYVAKESCAKYQLHVN